jgi:hypothetical protein
MPASDSPFDQQGRVLIGTDGGIWNSPDNTNGHGTHVAGTLGAVGNNGVGVAGSTSGATTGSFTLSFNGQTTYSLPGLESILDDLARDVASQSEFRSSAKLASFLAFPGFTGGVRVASNYNTVSGRVTGIAIDPSDAVGDLGNDWLSGGTGQDARSGGAASGGVLYVATDHGVYIGGDGRDVLLGGNGDDVLAGGYIKIKKLSSGD